MSEWFLNGTSAQLGYTVPFKLDVVQGRRKQIFVGGTPVSMMYIKSICLFVGAYINLFISPSPKTTTKARFNQCFLLSINKNDVIIRST